jgi:hypothetical protein
MKKYSEDKARLAGEYFMQGYNCSQAVVAAIAAIRADTAQMVAFRLDHIGSALLAAAAHPHSSFPDITGRLYQTASAYSRKHIKMGPHRAAPGHIVRPDLRVHSVPACRCIR